MTFPSVPVFGQSALNEQAPVEDQFLDFQFSENDSALPAHQLSLFDNPVNYPFLGDAPLLETDQDLFREPAFNLQTADGAASPIYSPYLAQNGFSPGIASLGPFLFSPNQLPANDTGPKDLRGSNPPSSPSSSVQSKRGGKLAGQSFSASGEFSAVGSTNPAKRGRKPKPKESPSDPKADILKAKATHSEIERRYRDNLKDKILQLHRTLLAIGANPRTFHHQGPSSSSTSTQAGKIHKAEIFTNAINYIHQSELEIRYMTNEIEQLRSQLYQLEQVAGSRDEAFRNLAL
ncbi:uncharacterized protein Z519_03915 [Cladophialophora bantiana CBS 173.52]|uniref:BHLH domain-containing protein n=1 Tax=Cladophialophora bantiana (strain ATCC 10958 / CBS 173.52 / CDC B-1940 / NIH 8579) TaxID=1442370 RepID=A0A0D2EZE3_CLAB1|nr:uncharacterized protein Z519_03915 [Cladophialophora bantiana CBS 173.52]KIW95331.1 hypothetical protein Z519_03915 [Cladophialophora bantiana CBS 173.52]